MLTAAKLVLPALAAALFVWGAAWCVVRTLRPQMADTAAVGGEPPRSSKAMAALAGLLFVCVLQLVFCHAAQANNPGVGLTQAMEWQFYGNTDARHYIDLAQYGYGTGGAFAEQELMIVFFPLFPALLRVVHLLVGGSYPLLGLAVQGPLFAGAAVSLYTLVSRRWGARQAVLTLALLMASPAAVFFAVPMTESLFLLVTVRYVLAWDRRQWGRCAVLGVLAGLCRAPGGLLLGLAALELAAAWRRGKRPALASILAMLAPAAGLGLYFGLNQAVYGRWNQYSVYQWEHWGQKLGLFTNTVRYHLDYLAAWWGDNRKMAIGISLGLPGRDDGRDLAVERPAVRSGAVLPAGGTGAAAAGPPPADLRGAGGAGDGERGVYLAVSARLADLLSCCRIRKEPVSGKETGSFVVSMLKNYFFCSAPCSMMSPKDRALYRPTLLAWRMMRSGRGLVSSVESRTMWTLSATSTPFSLMVLSTCRYTT